MTRSSTLALALFLGLTSAAMAQTSPTPARSRLQRLPSRRSPPRARQLSLKRNPTLQGNRGGQAGAGRGPIVLQDQEFDPGQHADRFNRLYPG